MWGNVVGQQARGFGTDPVPGPPTPGPGPHRGGRRTAQRLNDFGAVFLQLENAAWQIHVTWLAELQPGSEADGASDPLTLASLRAHVLERLEASPPLRWRLHRTLFGLRYPLLADDPDFDIDFHVRAVTLPDPGRQAELDELVARLAERQLDRRHPLWQMCLVDGLEGGRQAVILRLHHALWDGASGYTTLTRLLSDQPLAEKDEASSAATGPAGLSGLVPAATVGARARSRPRPVQLVWSTACGLAALTAHRRRAMTHVPKRTVDTPACSISGCGGVDVGFARNFVSTADIVRVKDAAGVTFNHVVLAIVASGLRRYLAERGELPDRPLNAMMPVSGDAPGAPPRQWGNLAVVAMTSLATDVDDPWERLQTIAAVARESKTQLDLLGVDTRARWTLLALPIISAPAVRLGRRLQRSHPERNEANLSISAVRCGDLPLTLRSRAVTRLSISGPTPSVMVTALTYGGELTLAVTTKAQDLPDPRALTDMFGPALAELLACVEDHRSDGTADHARLGGSPRSRVVRSPGGSDREVPDSPNSQLVRR